MDELKDIDLKEIIETETCQRFNRDNKILSPFKSEKTPSCAVYFDSNADKQKFKDFASGESGDVIDFIMLYRNMTYGEARQYLGLEAELNPHEQQENKLLEYIEQKQLKNPKSKRYGQKVVGVFKFVDINNKVIYYKVKFLDLREKKDISYYCIDENGAVLNSRGGHDEVPYNLYNTLRAANEGRTIVIVEGEKDVNTINKYFKSYSYAATSAKGVKKLSQYLYGGNLKIIVIPDTGAAGEKYAEEIKEQLLNQSKSFKIVKLPYLNLLGDNKDVTDYLEAGHTIEEIIDTFYRSLDLKNSYEFQQDLFGIYKTTFEKDSEDPKAIRTLITNFTIMESKLVRNIDENNERILLKLKSATRQTHEIEIRATAFNDVKPFNDALGSMDLTFLGAKKDMTNFKLWVNRYFALEKENHYNAATFIELDNGLSFVTKEGAYSLNKVDRTCKAPESPVSFDGIEDLTADELKILKENIFNVLAEDKIYSLVGTVIHDLTTFLGKQAKTPQTHLLIVGESGTGKTTILVNLVAPLLNLDGENIMDIGLSSKFALEKTLTTGNYPVMLDEYKPSRFSDKKNSELSGIFRSAYNRGAQSKGTIENGQAKAKKSNFNCPMIIAGEESFHSNEKAAIERTAIIYLSKYQRTAANTQATKFLSKNKQLLRKLNKSLILLILSLDVEQYVELRESKRDSFESLSDRIQDTAVNAATGIEIFNMLLEKHNMEKITDYEQHIETNIKEDVLNNNNSVHSVVEEILIAFNDAIEADRISEERLDAILYVNDDRVCIKTKEMLAEVNQYIRHTGFTDIKPLGPKDFTTQAYKAGYIVKPDYQLKKNGERNKRFPLYNMEKLIALGLDSICPPDRYLAPMELDEKEKEIFQQEEIQW